MIHGIDIANYQGEITLAQALAWKAAGITHVVVRCSLERQTFRNITREQLAVCVQAGLGVAVYVWAYFTVDDPAQVAADAIALCDEFDPDTYWIDCEDVQGYAFRDPAQNISWLARCITAFESRGERTGIYTGAWWWVPWMGNTTAFHELPLWDAEYDGRDWDDAWSHYGGWDFRVGKQYGGGDLDHDVWDPAYLERSIVPSIAEQLSYWGGFSHDVLPELIDRLASARGKRDWREVQAVCAKLEEFVSP